MEKKTTVSGLKLIAEQRGLVFLVAIGLLNVLMLREDFLENPSMLLKIPSLVIVFVIYVFVLVDNGNRGIYRHFFGILLVSTICVMLYKFFPNSSVLNSPLFGFSFMITVFAGAPFIYTALVLQSIITLDWKLIVGLLFLLYCIESMIRVFQRIHKTNR